MAKAAAKRSFGLSEKDAKAMKERYGKEKVFPNPYRGFYGLSIAALISLGINKFHPLAKVKELMAKTAGEEYKAFARKEARNQKTGKDADGRLVQNLKVLQRTKDYGLKLLQVGRRVLKSKGAVVDLSRNGKGELSFRLNTNSAKPQKLGRILPKGQKAKAARPGASKSKVPKKAA